MYASSNISKLWRKPPPSPLEETNIETNIEETIKPFGKENFQLFAVLGIVFFAVYYSPSIVAKIVVFGFLGLFLISKKDYFWLALFLSIYFTPLAFFNEYYDTAYRLPLFKIGPGASFSSQQLFLLTALLKALYKRKTYNYIIQSAFYILLAYFGILIVASIFIHHSSINTVIDTLKMFITWSLLFTIPVLLPNRNDVYKLIYLLLPLVFVVFLGGVFFYATGGVYIYNVVTPSQDIQAISHEYSDIAGRFIPHGGQFDIIYLGFILSLFFLNLKGGNKLYLYLIAVLSYIVIIMGATRSWFVVFTLIFGGFMLSTKNKGKNIVIFAIIAIAFLALLSQSEKGSLAFSAAWERTITIFELGKQGSESTDQITNKTDFRLPQQLEYIRENPVFGWGFTEIRGDGDVGNFALIVEVGFLGLALFFYLWFSYIRMILVAKKKLPKNSEYKIALNLFMYGFLGLLLSHFTTNRIFGILTAAPLLSLYFYFTDFFVKDSFRSVNQKNIVNKTAPTVKKSIDGIPFLP